MTKHKGRLSRREIIFIFIVLIIALPLIGWKSVGAPLLAEIKTLREMIDTVEKECDQLRTLIADEETILKEWSQWQEESDKLNTAMPDHAELAGVLGAIEEMLSTFSGTVHTLHVGESIDYSRYSAVDLTISITDQPAGIRTMLNSLAAFPHATAIEEISWTLQDDNTVQLDIGFRLFFFKHAPAEDADLERG